MPTLKLSPSKSNPKDSRNVMRNDSMVGSVMLWPDGRWRHGALDADELRKLAGMMDKLAGKTKKGK